MGADIRQSVTENTQEIQQVILEVTEQCNFRCKYCIYSENFNGNRNFGNKVMSRETAFKAVDWAMANSGKKLSINFYGGEPLLNFSLIKAVIERSQKNKGDQELIYSFTSNMSLMTPEIAHYLSKVPNLFIMASLDGPEDVHNAYRVYANSRPTFTDCLKGLKTLVSAYEGKTIPVSINAVLTPPFDFEKLDRVNAFFESLDWLPENCTINVGYPSFGTCPGVDEYFDKVANNPKYAICGSCNPVTVWQKMMAETNGLDQKHSRNAYYLSILEEMVRINNRLRAAHSRMPFGRQTAVPTGTGQTDAPAQPVLLPWCAGWCCV